MHGNCYGTSRAAVERVAADGRCCVLDIDVQGARSVKASGLPAVFAFVAPPSLGELEARLRGLHPSLRWSDFDGTWSPRASLAKDLGGWSREWVEGLLFTIESRRQLEAMVGEQGRRKIYDRHFGTDRVENVWSVIKGRYGALPTKRDVVHGTVGMLAQTKRLLKSSKERRYSLHVKMHTMYDLKQFEADWRGCKCVPL